ncbi:MAG: lysophospholipid acyltransferase family protein [Candidatus Dormibacteria bacterium]
MVDAGREPLLPVRRRLLHRWRRTGEPMTPYYLYRAASTAVRILPRWAALRLADGVADVMYASGPWRFAALRDNLRHVLPDLDEREMSRLVRRNLRDLTRGWAEVMAMPTKPGALMRGLRETNVDRYLDALARGKGVVVVSMHFGAWEAGLAAWNGGGGALALLAERLRPEKLFAEIGGARSALGVKVIPIDVEAMRNGDPQTARRLGAAAMREVYKHLRGGGAIAIAIDRDLTGTGTPIPFFGTEAKLPRGVVEVGIRAGAAIVPIALRRTAWGSEGLVFEERVYDPEAPHEVEAERISREILALFEDVIREHPEQWHVLDRVWEAPS